MNQNIGQNSVKGTEFKLNISMEPMDGFHLADVDFSADVFTEMGLRKGITIAKADAIKVDEDNYIICVDSAVCGVGKYYVRLTAHIPDTHFPDGLRTEIKTVYTGVTIDSL